jgi:hypothetical protein
VSGTGEETSEQWDAFFKLYDNFDHTRSLIGDEVGEARWCIRALINSWVPSPETKTDAEVARCLAVSESLIRWARA